MVFNEITNELYVGLITFLDQEVTLLKWQPDVELPRLLKKQRKVLVDFALKTGFDEFRFRTYYIAVNGDILFNSGEFVDVSYNIIELANSILRNKKELYANLISKRALLQY